MIAQCTCRTCRERNAPRRPLPVQEHLRPRPRRTPLDRLTPEQRQALPPEFVAVFGRVPIYASVDPARYPCGRGYDRVGDICPIEADLYPYEGQA
jgi:hypothetical protein